MACERLKGKVALITGASRGIGRAIAIEFAREGIDGVVVNYVKDDRSASETRKELENLGVKVLLVKTDISKRDGVKIIVNETLEIFGKIDILVNNAAILQQKPFETITDEEWDRMFEVNLKAPFMLIQEVIPYMIKQKWGRIIN